MPPHDLSSPTRHNDQETNASLIRTLQMPSAAQFANKIALYNFSQQIRVTLGRGELLLQNEDDDADDHPAGIRLTMLPTLDAELPDIDISQRNTTRDSVFSRPKRRAPTYNHRLSSYNGILGASTFTSPNGTNSSAAHIGTKLYNYIIFNLALSVPLSVILVIFSWNLSSVNERFLLDSRTEFTVDVTIWRHIITSLILDICFVMCFIAWVDYCVNGLIFFRYISVLIQVLAEKLTGYRASDANAHVREAQNLFFSKFSWKKWFVEALRFSSIIDVYKFHSIGWFAYLLVLFVVRNHLHPHLLPWGFHIAASSILCLFLTMSLLIGVVLQLPFGNIFNSRRRHDSRSKFSSLMQTIKRLRFLHIFSSVSEAPQDDHEFFPYCPQSPSSPRDALSHQYSISEEDYPLSMAPVPAISSINQDSVPAPSLHLRHSHSLTFILDDEHEKDSILSILFVNIFVFIIYALFGSGAVLVSLRVDQLALQDVNAWLLFLPFVLSITLLILYNLVSHLQLSVSYVYQNSRIYIPSACIMTFFFLFLLIQSVCILFLLISYAFKVSDVWSTDWIFVFLPLCVFEVMFSLIGVTIVLTAGLRILWFMWVQAKTVSRSEEVDESNLF